jgi:ribonuclease P protein component
VARPGFVLLVRAEAVPGRVMRYGITVSKRVGNAVVRNRVKRRFRALLAEVLPLSGLPGADHVLIGRETGIERPFPQLRDELRAALARVSSGKGDRPRTRPPGKRPSTKQPAGRPPT